MQKPIFEMLNWEIVKKQNKTKKKPSVGPTTPSTLNSFPFPLGLKINWALLLLSSEITIGATVKHSAYVASNWRTFCWMMERETIRRWGVFKKKEGGNKEREKGSMIKLQRQQLTSKGVACKWHCRPKWHFFSSVHSLFTFTSIRALARLLPPSYSIVEHYAFNLFILSILVTTVPVIL